MTGKSISPSAISGAIRMAQEHGTASERAAVVKWLRDRIGVFNVEKLSEAEDGAYLDAAVIEMAVIGLTQAADAIERGEHLQPQKDD